MHSRNLESLQMVVPMTPQQAGELVTRLLGCYPSPNLHDPETYIASVTALLCGYSYWVGERAVERVVNTAKFVPSRAEIVESCEHFAPSKRTMDSASEWDRLAAAQAEERLRIESSTSSAERERVLGGFAELRAHLHSGGDRRKAREFTPEAVKARYGITQEQWNAIPDLPREPDFWTGLRAAAAMTEPAE